MPLDTLAEVRNAFYRLLGTSSTDQAFIEHDTSTLEALYQHLTTGAWRAQRFLISAGMSDRWRKRSSAISWTGTEAADGGRYVALSTLAADFLRLSGDLRRSSLVEADGRRWGSQVEAEDDALRGDRFYLKNNQLWITKGASPPTTLYLDYHYRHPEVTSSTTTFDFPVDAMPLLVAEAASGALDESWVSGGQEMRQAVERNLERQRVNAKDVARQTREPRRMKSKPLANKRHFSQ